VSPAGYIYNFVLVFNSKFVFYGKYFLLFLAMVKNYKFTSLT